MNWILAGLLMMLPITSGEIIHKFLNIPAELNRKLVHISAGLAASVLPLLLSLDQVVILALAFTPPMIISHQKKLMKSMEGVGRESYGEIFFSLGVALAAFLATSVGAYAFAVLVMGISDGMASLLGKEYGKRKYKILSHEKSYFGSAVFAASSFVIAVLILNRLGVFTASLILPLVVISGLLALIESALSYGSDNLVVPVVAVLLFQSLIL